jgi:hypothetical protein
MCSTEHANWNRQKVTARTPTARKAIAQEKSDWEAATIYLRANKPMQPTPLCGLKIVAFLKAGIGPTVFPIYWCGAADGQAVGRILTLCYARSSLRH